MSDNQLTFLPVTDPKDKTLNDRFLVPPFSILDARQGYWQERKRQWLALGIQSELGRGENLLMQNKEVTTQNLNFYRNKNKLSPGGARATACNYSNRERGDGAGKAMGGKGMNSGTSVFDPVLCGEASLRNNALMDREIRRWEIAWQFL